MSLIIKNIDIPKRCADCLFNQMTFVEPGLRFPICLFTGDYIMFDDNARIKENCPLVPIDKDSKLIDKNKIGLTSFEILLCQSDDNPYKSALEMILEKIDKAPVILEGDN
jgi:hypothetical protein